jgi:polysaccharide pyruvyl transferase WcaK-like protein
MVRGSYDQSQIKYIIGLCDFFIGSRMHSCISALSQFIPAVGIAYSKKFHGVFESVGLQQYVADARSLNNDGVLQTVSTAFENKDQIREHLRSVIPGLTADILNLFRNYE